ncbi:MULTISPECIES: hypothetical protein [Pseudomonas]|uniref:hypothetical protein n=1 Tax=Pseudomonas TaxID=286 RepID=UPI001F3C3D90|nr:MULTISPECIES: hypothetical protein [Pseudomonas]
MWWEKTVEYMFVAELVASDRCDFAAPLSGLHERTAGDAIFAQSELFVLVEFKRRLSDAHTEDTLFENYQAALSELKGYQHHFIVYGLRDRKIGLVLKSRPYFLKRPTKSAIEILESGVSKDKFDEYLTKLATFKKPDDRGKGGGHVTSGAMSAVLGVSAAGKVVQVMSLHEYKPKLFPGPTPFLAPSSSLSSAPTR